MDKKLKNRIETAKNLEEVLDFLKENYNLKQPLKESGKKVLNTYFPMFILMLNVKINATNSNTKTA